MSCILIPHFHVPPLFGIVVAMAFSAENGDTKAYAAAADIPSRVVLHRNSGG